MKTQINLLKKTLPLVVFMMLTLSSFAQNFKSEIEKHREGYRQAFLNEKGSPLKQQDLIDLSFFEPDSTYAVIATVTILADEVPFSMPTYNGKSHPYIRYAKLKFNLNGKAQELTLYKSISLSQLAEYKDYLFLPFTDATNGKETYSGGRYIDLNVQDTKNDVIKIDFNKAYNPYCAYSEGYQCPKPPAENEIKQNINAGEKAFSGAKKH